MTARKLVAEVTRTLRWQLVPRIRCMGLPPQGGFKLLGVSCKCSNSKSLATPRIKVPQDPLFAAACS